MIQPIIYLISGLGADEKIYKNIHLQPYQTSFIKWVQPEPKDTITSYAHKLIKQVDTTKPVILIGVSMGGILAKEMKKHIDVKACIIISSIQCSSQFTNGIKLSAYIPMLSYIPVKVLKILNKFTAPWFFSVHNPAEKKLLLETIDNTDPVFLKWALKILPLWKDNSIDKSILHIHGTHDRIFPINNIHTPTTTIINGGHLMILNRAKEIESLILNSINSL